MTVSDSLEVFICYEMPDSVVIFIFSWCVIAARCMRVCTRVRLDLILISDVGTLETRHAM